MKKTILALALLLGACNSSLGGAGVATLLPSPPAPLAATAIDDTALQAAWKAFDVALDAITLLRTKGIIKVGSPVAIKVANGIDRVSAALQAAEHAAAAGSSKSYLAALSEAKLALTDIRIALRGN